MWTCPGAARAPGLCVCAGKGLLGTPETRGGPTPSFQPALPGLLNGGKDCDRWWWDFFRTRRRGSLLSPNLAPFSKLLPSQERNLDILSYSPKASKERGLPRGELANLGFESPETSILLGLC